MAEATIYKKTIKYSENTDAKLQKLADKAGCTKRDFFIRMVDYFDRTKKDPTDINDELLKNALAKNHDTYIRFIRAQEENLLIPVKTEVDRMIQSQVKILDCFNTQILKANKDLLDRQQAQSAQLQLIAERQDTKDSLKAKFLYILNQYAKLRDGFSFTTSAKEKDDLVQAARQQVSKL